MPAEWEPHAATWIAWPHNAADWPGRFPPIPWIYGEIVRLIAEDERVCILVNDRAARDKAARILSDCHVNIRQVTFYQVPTDRVWTRDSGPIFVVDKSRRQLAATNWTFNAWAKYRNWKRDDKVSVSVAGKLKIPVFTPVAGTPSQRMVLEGGSVDVNGAGLLLTTEECLLSEVQQRNPGLSREEIEACLHDYLGVTNVLWLKNGIAGDDTHGHIDDLARFTSGTSIVIASEADPGDANHEPLKENLGLLKETIRKKRLGIRVATLPMPSPVIFKDQRLPASYANFYITNRKVLVPVFNDPNDAAALNILQKQFPDRKVVGVYCRDLVWGLGTLHCMTQQQPATKAS